MGLKADMEASVLWRRGASRTTPAPTRPGADPERGVGVDASGRAGGGQHDGTTDDSVVSHELDHRPRIHPQKCSPEHTIGPRAFRTCR